MHTYLYFIFVICLSFVKADQKWENIQTQTPTDVQEKEAEKLLLRLLPEHSHLINIKILGSSFSPKNRDQVTIVTKFDESNEINAVDHDYKTERKVLTVTANTGVAAIWGINHYLKYFCNSHISWDTTRIGKLKSLALLFKLVVGDLYYEYSLP